MYFKYFFFIIQFIENVFYTLYLSLIHICYADVFHCEPIEKTADDFITNLNIPTGSFDNVSSCRYNVPDYWTIGEVYERLIEDVPGDDTDHLIDILIEVYTSWIDDAISNYNTDFYYQSRECIFECYREGKICA